ncbi:MAG: Txe/YoeB family addiction module toxin [Gammaproteobacteria bacterium]|nr:Txe/YoeB family addiction module toxin [Gammaproteobacteria bacterium]
MAWQVVLSRQAVKDANKLARAGLKSRTEVLLHVLRSGPLQAPPRYEKLVGNLSGIYSRRINIQHRLVYRIDQQKQVVHVLRMWTHYK